MRKYPELPKTPYEALVDALEDEKAAKRAMDALELAAWQTSLQSGEKNPCFACIAFNEPGGSFANLRRPQEPERAEQPAEEDKVRPVKARQRKPEPKEQPSEDE